MSQTFGMCCALPPTYAHKGHSLSRASNRLSLPSSLRVAVWVRIVRWCGSSHHRGNIAHSAEMVGLTFCGLMLPQLQLGRQGISHALRLREIDAMSHIIVRNSTHTDMSAVQRIYAYHVLHGLGSFEEEPPSLAELRRRRDDVIEHGLPYLVADIDGAVVGYSYATLYRDRSAYRYTVEDSVYVDQGVNGKGVGRALLSA